MAPAPAPGRDQGPGVAPDPDPGEAVLMPQVQVSRRSPALLTVRQATAADTETVSGREALFPSRRLLT